MKIEDTIMIGTAILMIICSVAMITWSIAKQNISWGVYGLFYLAGSISIFTATLKDIKKNDNRLR